MENEFLFELNSKIITDNYNNEFINNIFKYICNYINADSISYYNENEQVNHNDYIINLDNNSIIIKNIKKNLNNKEYFFKSLTLSLNNMFKVKRIIEKLNNEKYIDSTLEVNNRNAYNFLLNKKTSYNNIGILFVDANNLGVINNLMGYEKGDELLRCTVYALKSNFRFTDIYRIGGDEFVVICPNISEELFNKKIEASKLLMEETPYSFSLGKVYEEETNDLSLLIKQASINMKKEKEEYRKNNPDIYINKYTVTSIEDNVLKK